MAELRVLETRPARIHTDVVQILEAALEQARRGELSCVAVAAVLADGMTGRNVFSRTEYKPALLGSIALMQARVINPDGVP
jgi:hypothetical protein